MSQYLHHSRSAYYAVVTALPLLIAYELLLLADTGDRTVQIRNAADVWMRELMASVGMRPTQATLAMILILLLSIPLVYRRDQPLRGTFFGLMLVEAVLYSLVLGLLIQVLLQFLLSPFMSAVSWWNPALQSGGMGQGGLLQSLALSLGAGLFEEFVFRVVLLAALIALTRLVFAGWVAVGLSILTAAFLFALAHHIGPLGEPFTLPVFLFRWIAGLLFTILYHTRGFAIVAYAHALYDIRVLVF